MSYARKGRHGAPEPYLLLHAGDPRLPPAKHVEDERQRKRGQEEDVDDHEARKVDYRRPHLVERGHPFFFFSMKRCQHSKKTRKETEIKNKNKMTVFILYSYSDGRRKKDHEGALRLSRRAGNRLKKSFNFFPTSAYRIR